MMKALTPHPASPKLLEIDGSLFVPTVVMSAAAYRDTHHIIRAAGKEEVGWLGSVRRTDEGTLLIEQVFVIEQDVGMAHTEFDEKDLGKFYLGLARTPEGRALAKSILFWGHVHPFNDPSPSQQDDDQMALFANNPWFLRGIFTREGICEFTYYDYVRGLAVRDCPWELEVPATDGRAAEIATEVAAKVRKEVPRIPRRRAR